MDEFLQALSAWMAAEADRIRAESRCEMDADYFCWREREACQRAESAVAAAFEEAVNEVVNARLEREG